MFRVALILMIAAEGLSLAVFNFPAASLPLLIVAGVAVFILSIKKLEWGIYLLFAELFFGSRGHLLEYDLGFASISLRLVIFASVFLIWASSVILTLSRAKGKNPSEIKRSFGLPQDDKTTAIYCLFILVIVFGIANGFLNGNSLANIFNDANGYLYLLIFPAVVSAIKTREQIENLLQILAAAVLAIAAKTLILFIWFAFGLPGVAPAYYWVINQDFGEITGEVGSASRIFMQSQFYALMGLFIFGISTLPQPLPSREGNKKENSSPLVGEVRWGVISAAILSVLMSLSRSFWLGAMAGGLFALIMMLWYFRAGFKPVLSLGLKILLIAVVEVAGLYLLINFGSGGFANAVASRGGNPATEAAGGARLLLLPELLDSIKQSPLIGTGFGKEVTYKSYLPDRVTAQNPDGEITSYAFEWGYLDIMLKVGFIGLLVYLFFIARIFKNLEFRMQNLGLLSALVALLILNITTPYLNHPLGIGYLILVYLYEAAG